MTSTVEFLLGRFQILTLAVLTGRVSTDGFHWPISPTVPLLGILWPIPTGRVPTDGFLLADPPSYPATHGRLSPTAPFLGQTGEVTENSSRSVVSSSVDELPHFSGASRPIHVDQREALL